MKNERTKAPNTQVGDPGDTVIEDWARAEVMLGNPRFECQGVGICRVMSYQERTDCMCPKVIAWVGVAKNGRIRILFEKDGMDGSLLAAHFAHPQFQVEAPCRLAGKIANDLGLQEVKLRPGMYPIKQSDRYFWVDF